MQEIRNREIGQVIESNHELKSNYKRMKREVTILNVLVKDKLKNPEDDPHYPHYKNSVTYKKMTTSQERQLKGGSLDRPQKSKYSIEEEQPSKDSLQESSITDSQQRDFSKERS